MREFLVKERDARRVGLPYSVAKIHKPQQQQPSWSIHRIIISKQSQQVHKNYVSPKQEPKKEISKKIKFSYRKLLELQAKRLSEELEEGLNVVPKRLKNSRHPKIQCAEYIVRWKERYKEDIGWFAKLSSLWWISFLHAAAQIEFWGRTSCGSLLSSWSLLLRRTQLAARHSTDWERAQSYATCRGGSGFPLISPSVGAQAGGTTILQSGMCHVQLGMWGARLSGNRFGRPGPGESEPRPTPEHYHHEGRMVTLG